jgi:hypothetical protein
MSDWTTRVQNHRVWTLMSELGPLIDLALQVDIIDEVGLAGLERLRTVLTYCGKRLGGADPSLILQSVLEAMAGSFESQKAEVQGFTSDKNAAHITTANVAADNALLSAFQVPGVLTPEEQIESVKHIISYRNSIETLAKESLESRAKAMADTEELNSAVSSLKRQVEGGLLEIQAQMDAEQDKLAKLLADEQKLFTDAQTSRNNTFNETVLRIQDNLTKTVTEQQGQFSTAQENRNQKFGDLVTDYTKRLSDQDAEFAKQGNELKAEADKKLGSLWLEFEHSAERILKEVVKHKENVEKLVGVIGSLGVTHGYQTTANRARISMYIWQAITVSAMCGFIGFAYYAFLPSIKADFRWESFAARVFLTITVGVLAAYAGSQADRFFHMEQTNRKLALELAAIDPFIALWPIEEQNKFKLEVGKRTFAQDEIAVTKIDKSPATTLDLLAKDGLLQDLVKIAIQAGQKGVKS